MSATAIGLPSVEPGEFREALGCFATGVTVIPISSPRGPTAVMTVTPVAKQPSASLKSPGSTDGIPMAVADIILPSRTGLGSEAPGPSQRRARVVWRREGDGWALEPGHGLP